MHHRQDDAHLLLFICIQPSSCYHRGWEVACLAGDRATLSSCNRDLSEQSCQLLVTSIGQDLLQISKHPGIRLFRRAAALTSLLTIELLWSGEQRPSPPILAVVTVYRIYKVLCDHVCAHLKSGDETVKPATHPLSIETTSCPQLAREHTAPQSERVKDGGLYRVIARQWKPTPTIVAKIGPPLPADESSLTVEKLTIGTMAFGEHLSFPFP